MVPNVPPVVYSRLIPDIYHYWQSKRKRYNKPCCRKFWPATSVTDTNPHMVFRPREKERYRLRKHRKNDLDSYRKLQQLRREFAVAQNLMQLVIERERLKKADLAIQNDVIAQNIFEIQFPNSLVPRVEPFQQFSYQLQYPHLLKTDPPVASKKKDQPDLKLKGNRYVLRGFLSSVAWLFMFSFHLEMIMISWRSKSQAESQALNSNASAPIRNPQSLTLSRPTEESILSPTSQPQRNLRMHC